MFSALVYTSHHYYFAEDFPLNIPCLDAPDVQAGSLFLQTIQVDCDLPDIIGRECEIRFICSDA